jgi:opacity protein-like surface antigen
MGLSLPAATTYTEHRETRAYAGLQWFIGETSVTKPSVVLGLRTTTTHLSNKVTGYDLSYTYSLETSTSDAFRAGYLDGKCSAGLATVGLGYSFKKETVLGFAGVVGSHAKAFGEVDGKKDFGAGLELNTLPYAGEPEKTTQTFSIPAWWARFNPRNQSKPQAMLCLGGV